MEDDEEDEDSLENGGVWNVLWIIFGEEDDEILDEIRFDIEDDEEEEEQHVQQRRKIGKTTIFPDKQ